VNPIYSPGPEREPAPGPRPGRGFAARRTIVVRDFLIFALKLGIDGLKDVVLFQIASIAVLADLLRGEGHSRLFYKVVRQSERFDLWLNLNGALDELERGETEDGLFGASTAGSDTLLGKMEGWVRGNDYDDPDRPDRDPDDLTRP
jgi:hypothetical protein